MLIAFFTLLFAVVLKEILRFFDHRYERSLAEETDEEERISRVMAYRRRYSNFQVGASVAFMLPFIYISTFKRGFLQMSAEVSHSVYVGKVFLLTLVIFTLGSIFVAAFFRLSNRPSS